MSIRKQTRKSREIGMLLSAPQTQFVTPPTSVSFCSLQLASQSSDPQLLRFSEGVAGLRPPRLWSSGGVKGLRRPADFRRDEYGKGYAEQGSDGPAGAGSGLDRKCVVN